MAAFIERLVYATIIHPPESFFHSDMRIYGQISDAILLGDWKVSHFFQPVGYPVLIAAIKLFTNNWTLALAILQSLFGALTLLFTGLTIRAFWGKKIEVLFLLAGLVHVPWIIYTGYAMPETTYAFLLSLLLWTSARIFSEERRLWPVLWGVSFILAFWVKGQHAFLFPLFLVGITLLRKDKLKAAVLIAVVVFTGMGLHWGWTYTKTGTGKFSADAGGLNFIEGKCPSKKNTDPETGITWWSPLYHNLHMDKEKRWDRPFSDSPYYMKEGMKCIAADPWVLIQSFENIPFLFYGNWLWPANWQPMAGKVRLYELFFVFFALPGLLYFFLVMIRTKNALDLLVWGLPVISLFLCVYVFKSEIRFRIPYDIFIIPMAIRGWALVSAQIPGRPEGVNRR